MDPSLSSTSVRLVSVILLAAAAFFHPAQAQEDMDCFAEFAGCKLCEWENCEIIYCPDTEEVLAAACTEAEQ